MCFWNRRHQSSHGSGSGSDDDCVTSSKSCTNYRGDEWTCKFGQFCGTAQFSCFGVGIDCLGGSSSGSSSESDSGSGSEIASETGSGSGSRSLSAARSSTAAESSPAATIIPQAATSSVSRGSISLNTGSGPKLPTPSSNLGSTDSNNSGLNSSASSNAAFEIFGTIFVVGTGIMMLAAGMF